MVRVQYGPVWREYSKGLTNRRYLMVLGALMTVVGVVGFFLGTDSEDLYHIDIGQSIAYLVMGVFTWYVGEVWNSPIKRGYNVVIGAFFAAIAIAGFIMSAVQDASNGSNLYLFYVSHPWENATHLTIGVIFLATALYRRRFREYSVGSAASD